MAALSGDGRRGETGTGSGAGYTVNLPVPPGSGDAAFGSLVEHVAVLLARAYAPGLLLVSAGFDAHADDPLAGCTVTDAGYATMGASIRALADELDVPVGVVLEGGYDLRALSRGLIALLEALGADGLVSAPELPVHALSEGYLARHAALLG